jgi:hypothetical protein
MRSETPTIVKRGTKTAAPIAEDLFMLHIIRKIFGSCRRLGLRNGQRLRERLADVGFDPPENLYHVGTCS